MAERLDPPRPDLVGDDHVATYLTNPSVAADRKLTTLESALDTSLGCSPRQRNLMKLLIQRDRIAMIPQIKEIFDDQVRAERGIVIADVTTAEPLTDAERDLVRQKIEVMTGNKIEIIAPSIPTSLAASLFELGTR